MVTTFGVEEEFQFLDSETLRPADVGAYVFAALASSPDWRDVTHKEFLASQVEHSSAVFTDLEESRTALVGFRRFMADRAAELGVIAAILTGWTKLMFTFDLVTREDSCPIVAPGERTA